MCVTPPDTRGRHTPVGKQNRARNNPRVRVVGSMDPATPAATGMEEPGSDTRHAVTRCHDSDTEKTDTHPQGQGWGRGDPLRVTGWGRGDALPGRQWTGVGEQ